MSEPVTELVIFEGDKEVDWYDPVIEFEDKDECLQVWNGFSTYLIVKYPGMTYEIRLKG